MNFSEFYFIIVCIILIIIFLFINLLFTIITFGRKNNSKKVFEKNGCRCNIEINKKQSTTCPKCPTIYKKQDVFFIKEYHIPKILKDNNVCSNNKNEIYTNKPLIHSEKKLSNFEGDKTINTRTSCVQKYPDGTCPKNQLLTCTTNIHNKYNCFWK